MGGATLEQKLDILMSLATDDRDGLPPRLGHTREVGALRPLNIRNLRPGPGMRTSLLRVLMTNACSYNCHYCPMRRDREMPRTLLKPEELVRIFLGARLRGWCEGLFILSRPSSCCVVAIASPDTSTSSWWPAPIPLRSSG
jgi:predicted DNA-binding helix-hairpin-helix protein